MSPDRLFEAAEAVAALIRDAVGRAGGAVSVRELLHLSNLQARLSGFSPEECVEGARFLIRLGILEVEA